MADSVDWVHVREGGSHRLYRMNGRNIPIPRHKEINEMTARGILDTALKHAKAGSE